MYLYRRGAHGQFSRPDITKFVVAVSGIVPLLQLTVEEPLQWRVVHQFLLTLEHLLTGEDLKRTQAILIEIVCIDALDAEGRVTVTSPAATQVELCEDAPDAVVAREDESQGVVLTIAGVGEADLSEQGCEECTRGTQTIDAQGVVRAVFVCPLLMIDESWRQGVQLEVAHAIGADHHGCILFVESVYDLLQCLRRRVEVIGVELHGKASAAVVVDGLVPAAADAEVGALRDDVHEALVVEATQ